MPLLSTKGRLQAHKAGLDVASQEGLGISVEHAHTYRCHLPVFSMAVNLQHGLGLNLATSQLGARSIQ